MRSLKKNSNLFKLLSLYSTVLFFIFMLQQKEIFASDYYSEDFLNETSVDGNETDIQMSALNLADINSNGLDDEFEMNLAKTFIPKIWGDPGEECGPYQLNDVWCKDGIHPARHSKGFIGYHVKDMGFSDLWAIEYTVFMDRDCGWAGFGNHYFDNEGFTVLVKKTGTSFVLESLQSFTHHNTNWEMVDRYFPHELYKYGDTGLLMSKNKHGLYVHHRICDGALDNAEACGRYPDAVVLFNNGIRMLDNLYNISSCPCCMTLGDQQCMSCWDNNLTHSACYAKNLNRYGRLYDECQSWDDWPSNLASSRKQLPPFIPIALAVPPNYAYVELWEYPNYTFDPDRDEMTLKLNFGKDLVNAGMPMRLFCFNDYGWWREYYDPAYMRLKDEKARGLWSHAQRYKYWTSNDDFHYVDGSVRSLRLHGLPGTVLAIYDHNNGTLYPLKSVIISNNKNTYSVNELGDLKTMEFVSWGFGPTAYAGPDRKIKPEQDGTVTLDGRASYRYALNKTTLRTIFGVQTFDYSTDWKYEWYRRDGQTYTFLGNGAKLQTKMLDAGFHTIRLKVSGWRYPWPDDPATKSYVTVWDESQITVEEADEEDDPIPGVFRLGQNFPNPFNITTTVEYDLEKQSFIRLVVYDVLGRDVKTLVEVDKPAGKHSVVWDGRDEKGRLVKSGAYFYRIETDNKTEAKKMLLLR